MQAFGIVYHRSVSWLSEYLTQHFNKPRYEPNIKGGQCKGKVLAVGVPDRNIVYSARMGYGVIACVVGTGCLVYSSRIQGVFNTSKFVRRVLRNDQLYTIVVFLANLWVVLEFPKGPQDRSRRNAASCSCADCHTALDSHYTTPKLRSAFEHRRVLSLRNPQCSQDPSPTISARFHPSRQPARPRDAVGDLCRDVYAAAVRRAQNRRS
ncbi:hypothetical protein C8R43DRAFT_621068 [Mycena crocata]|nr:hypothetical protein C8R43DRAFT_621068 [Mycena crocata]